MIRTAPRQRMPSEPTSASIGKCRWKAVKFSARFGSERSGNRTMIHSAASFVRIVADFFQAARDPRRFVFKTGALV